MKATLESLHKAGVNFSVFDKVRIEPTDARFVIFFTFLQSSVCALKFMFVKVAITFTLELYRLKMIKTCQR